MADPPAIRSGFLLADYVREIATTHYGLRVLRLRISELRPDNRDDDALRALEDALHPLVISGLTRVFRLPEGDYLLAFARDDTDRVRALLVRLRFLVPEDPLAGHFDDPPGRDSPLLRWWDLETDFPRLRALAERYEADAIARAEARAQRDGSRAGMAKGDAARAAAEAEERAAAARLGPSDSGSLEAGPAGAGAPGDEAAPDWRPFAAEGRPRPGPWATPADGRAAGTGSGRRPIDADILDRLENGLARADLSNHVRRQPVCALVGRAPPHPLFYELYVSIPELRDTIAPRIDLMANRWLFQHFTETLDRRVLAWLNREGPRLSKGGFSININVQTILSEPFLRFEQGLAAGLHGTVVLELRVEDVFADLEAYAFARDFVHQRGYRVCLDYLDPSTMVLLDRDRLGADLMKLFWHRGLPERMAAGDGLALAERLRRGEGARTILARCDDPAAIALGRALEITMFQGHHVDALLAGGAGPVSPGPDA